MLIALFERAVGLYATLINVNAYHQPGVEGGKKAAGKVIEVQGKVFDFLSKQPGKPFTIEEIAKGIGMAEDIEHIFKICEHLSENTDKKVRKTFDRSILRNKYASV
jgi:glucose-6-phosphate isomerase